MAKRQLTPEFREFLVCLNRADVEYLLVGGFAVNFYGYHRYTEDIAFWIAVFDENFDRRLQAIHLFFGEDLTGLDKSFLRTNDTLFFGRVPNKIEVFQNADGLNFKDAFRRAVRNHSHGNAIEFKKQKAQRTLQRPGRS